MVYETKFTGSTLSKLCESLGIEFESELLNPSDAQNVRLAVRLVRIFTAIVDKVASEAKALVGPRRGHDGKGGASVRCDRGRNSATVVWRRSQPFGPTDFTIADGPRFVFRAQHSGYQVRPKPTFPRSAEQCERFVRHRGKIPGLLAVASLIYFLAW
jgi:hypothetical protein